eukprot:4441112-Prymnesium_polylepis.1
MLGPHPLFVDSDVFIFAELPLLLPRVHCHSWQPCMAVIAPGALMAFTQPALVGFASLIEHSYLDAPDAASAPMPAMHARLRRVTDMTFVRLLLERDARLDAGLAPLLARCPRSAISNGRLQLGDDVPPIHSFLMNWSHAVSGSTRTWGCVPAAGVLGQRGCVAVLSHGAASEQKNLTLARASSQSLQSGAAHSYTASSPTARV